MSKKQQLFCFTFAGGTAAFFDSIEKDLPAIDVVKMEYSGHGTRRKEEYYDSFDELANDMYGILKKGYTGGKYALFGYSMGAIALVEVLNLILSDSDMELPSNIFLAAHEPQVKNELKDFAEDESDEWVKRRTIQFGAVPEKLLNNHAFWRVYLPIYRHDYTLIGKYRFEELNLKTAIPAVVFYSETDTSISDMEKWKKYFVGKCEFHCYEGTHFFIQEHHKKIAAVINNRLSGRCINDV